MDPLDQALGIEYLRQVEEMYNQLDGVILEPGNKIEFDFSSVGGFVGNRRHISSTVEEACLYLTKIYQDAEAQLYGEDK